MSVRGDESFMSVDVSASPSMEMQCVETESSPPAAAASLSLNALHPKYVTSGSYTCFLSPKYKANTISRYTSSFHRSFNPFNKNLKERLEKPVFSPTVFSNVMSPSQDSDQFKWTIEDLSKINPAPIEEEFHFEEQVDEQTETEMQRSIDKYFMMTHKIPSPGNCKLPTSWNSFTDKFKQEKQSVLLNEPACSSPFPMSMLEYVSRTPAHDASTQTVLSLPPDLPENINSMLKPYFSDSSLDDMNNSMNSSLRRKLFFQKEDNSLSPASLFRVQEDSPLISGCSNSAIKLRTDGSPFEHFSPLDVSPIELIDKKSTWNHSPSQVDIGIQSDINCKKENFDPARKQTDQVYEECYKVFESPKLSTGVRRKRKRLSQSMDMSMTYSNFIAKHNSTEQMPPKFSACPEESRICFDTLSDNAVDSEDTGYGTATASFEKFPTRSESNLRLTFNSWLGKLKDTTNTVNASTPTKT